MRSLDHPFVFLIVITVLVLAVAHLLHMAGRAVGGRVGHGLAEFTSLSE